MPAVFEVENQSLVVREKLPDAPARLAVVAGSAVPFAEGPEGRATLSAAPANSLPDGVLRDSGSSFTDSGGCRGWVSPGLGAVGFEGAGGSAAIESLAVSWPNPVAASNGSRWLAAAGLPPPWSRCSTARRAA